MSQPIMTGHKTDNGNIYLKQVTPPTVLERLVKFLAGIAWRLIWLTVAFLAGFIAGGLWA